MDRADVIKRFIFFILAVYLIETGIMFLYDYIGLKSYILGNLLDGLILSIFVIPLLCVLFFNPLLNQLKTLKSKNSELDFILQFIPDIVYNLDTEGKFTFVSNSITKLGYNSEELVGKHFSEILLPSEVKNISRKHVLQKYKDVKTGNDGAPKLFDERRNIERCTKELEVQIKLKDGKSRREGMVENIGGDTVIADVNSCGRYICSSKNANEFIGTIGVITDIKPIFIGTTGIIRDITTQKLTEKALWDTEEKYQALMSSASDAIILLDSSGKIIECNKKAEVLLGRSESDLKGLSIEKIHPQSVSKKINKMFQSILETGSGYLDDTNILFNGKEVPVDITGSVVIIGGHKVIQEIIRDISERKEIEQELKKNELLLMQQSKLASMGEMMSAIAHQWRQPLNSLSLLVQDIKDAYEYGELDDKYIEQATKASTDQIKLMSTTIDTFRNFCKPSQRKTTFNVVDSIKEALSLISSQLKNNNIHYVMDVKTSRDIIISAYKNEFLQVVLNILHNSKEAILENRQRIEDAGKIEIAIIEKDNSVEINICDNGGGIQVEVEDKLFEPYFTTKTQGKGTGIGLYMSKKIIEEHMRGQLTFENLNNGAMFKIKLLDVFS